MDLGPFDARKPSNSQHKGNQNRLVRTIQSKGESKNDLKSILISMGIKSFDMLVRCASMSLHISIRACEISKIRRLIIVESI